MKKIFIVAAALAAANGAYAAAPGPAADASPAGFAALLKCGAADIGHSFQKPGQPPVPQAAPPQSACFKPAVRIDPRGDIYNGQTLLGRGAVAFKTGCTNDAAWTDRSGNLYRNTERIGREVSDYAIAAFTGDVIWTDRYGYLYRNSSRIGSAFESREINAFTGQVVWRDSFGYLYRNEGLKTERIGSGVKEYKVSAFTGTAAWLDTFNTLYRNSGGVTARLCSDVVKFAVAARTGQVAALDRQHSLFLDGLLFSRGVKDFSLRADGSFSWTGLDGAQHSA